jgi:hypothetical protein
MALVKCNECNTEISDKATSCPKCGHPTQSSQNKIADQFKIKSGLLKNVLIVLGVLFLVLVVANHAHYLFGSSPKVVVEKPAMPIEVNYRKAMLANGLVAIFKNDSTRNLSVLATFENPTLHQKKSFRVDLGPGGSKEVGHLEGWNFESGDLITLEHNDYSTLRVKFP